MRDEAPLLRRVGWRLLPVPLLAVMVETIGFGFSLAEMAGDLQLDAGVLRSGQLLFLLGFVLAAVPSNLVLMRIGGRRWLSRIIGLWGLVTVLLALAPGPGMVLGSRFLQGAGVGGLLAGIPVLIMQWFPAAERGRITGCLVLAGLLAQAVAGPVEGAVFSAEGALGLRAWQLELLGMGFAALLLGVVIVSGLPDQVDLAEFLEPAERFWLTRRLAADAVMRGMRERMRGLCVLAAHALLFGATGAAFSQMARDATVWPWLWAALAAGLLSMWPGMTGRAAWVVGLASIVGVGLSWFAAAPAIGLRPLALYGAGACVFLAVPAFWTWPGRIGSGLAGAAGIGAITAAGGLGWMLGAQIPILPAWLGLRGVFTLLVLGIL